MVVNCSTATKLAFQTWRVYVLHMNAASVSIQLTSIAKKPYSGNAELTRVQRAVAHRYACVLHVNAV